MVVVGTGSSGTRFLNKDYPVEEGLTEGTTKRSQDSPRLKADEIKMEEGWGSI